MKLAPELQLDAKLTLILVTVELSMSRDYKVPQMSTLTICRQSKIHLGAKVLAPLKIILILLKYCTYISRCAKHFCTLVYHVLPIRSTACRIMDMLWIVLAKTIGLNISLSSNV